MMTMMIAFLILIGCYDDTSSDDDAPAANYNSTPAWDCFCATTFEDLYYVYYDDWTFDMCGDGASVDATLDDIVRDCVDDIEDAGFWNAVCDCVCDPNGTC